MRILLCVTILSGCVRRFEQLSNETLCEPAAFAACVCASGSPGTSVCDARGQPGDCDCASVRISPDRAIMTAGETLQLTATVSEAVGASVTWTASAGSIDENGLFTAPSGATSVAIGAAIDKHSASATVTVASQPLTPEIALVPEKIFLKQAGVIASLVNPLADLTYDWAVTGGTPKSSTRGDHIVFDVTSDVTVFLSVTATNAANARGVAAIIAVDVFAPLPSGYVPAISAPSLVTEGRDGVEAFVSNPRDELTYEWRLEGGASGLSQSGPSARFAIASPATQATVFVRAVNAGGQATPEASAVIQVAARGYELIAGHPTGYGDANGIGANARLTAPRAIVAANGFVYVADENKIRKLDPNTFELTTVSTTGDPLMSATALAAGSDGTLYLYDGLNFQTLDAAGDVKFLLGGALPYELLSTSNAFALDNNDAIHVSLDYAVSRLLLSGGSVTGSTGVVGTASAGCNPGDGNTVAAEFNAIYGLAFHPGTNDLWLSSANGSSVAVQRIVNANNAEVIAGEPCAGGSVVGPIQSSPGALSFAGGSLFIEGRSELVYRLDGFDGPSPVLTQLISSGPIRDGPGNTAGHTPFGLAFAGERLFMLVRDPIAPVIRELEAPFAATGGTGSARDASAQTRVTTRAGTLVEGSSHVNGQGSQARVGVPLRGTFLPSGGLLYVDKARHCIRQVSSTGLVSDAIGRCNMSGALNGSSASATFSEPRAVVRSSTGSLFIADSGNRAIRRVLNNGFVTNYTKVGGGGIVDGPRLSAELDRPTSLALDSKDTLYFSETDIGVLRSVFEDEVISLAGKRVGCAGMATANVLGGAACLPNLRALALMSDTTMYALSNETLVEITLTPPFEVGLPCPGIPMVDIAVRGEELVALVHEPVLQLERQRIIGLNPKTCVSRTIVGGNGLMGNHTGPLTEASLGLAKTSDRSSLLVTPDRDLIFFDANEKAIFRVRD